MDSLRGGLDTTLGLLTAPSEAVRVGIGLVLGLGLCSPLLAGDSWSSCDLPDGACTIRSRSTLNASAPKLKKEKKYWKIVS